MFEIEVEDGAGTRTVSVRARSGARLAAWQRAERLWAGGALVVRLYEIDSSGRWRIASWGVE